MTEQSHSQLDTGQKAEHKGLTVAKKILGFLGRALGGFFKTLAPILVFFLFFALIGSLLPSGLGRQPPQEVFIKGQGEAKIVVVPLSGLILNTPDEAPLFAVPSQVISPDKIRDLLTHIKNDDQAAAVILSLESPGGSAVASDRIFEEIQNFKKDSRLPVVALLGDTAASGGYYLAAAADAIVANPATLTGSIGVIANAFNLESLYEKLGIKQRVFKQGEFKDILSPHRDISPQETAMIDSILQDSYELFLGRVSQGRKISLEKVRSLADGKIYSGTQAKEVGLVDELGNLDAAFETSKKLAGLTQARLVQLQTGGLLESFFGGISLSFLNRLFPPTSSPVTVWYLLTF